MSHFLDIAERVKAGKLASIPWRDIERRIDERTEAKKRASQGRVAKAARGTGQNGRKPEPREEKPEGTSRGVGVARAHEAINYLIRIPKNDGLRKRGFQIVADWIEANR
jgi:hypothetical protein